MITTTLNRIRAHKPCEDGWEKLLNHLGKTKSDDEVLPFETIVESNGLEDALWCCRCEPQYAKEWRLFAVWCVRQVEHLLDDERSRTALDVAEKFANGEATSEELAAALAAAWDAALDAARDTAWAAALAAARDTAWAAAWEAALEAALEATLDAARVASLAAARAAAGAASLAAAWEAVLAASLAAARVASLAAARDAALAAALAAAREKQKEEFLKIVITTEARRAK